MSGTNSETARTEFIPKTYDVLETIRAAREVSPLSEATRLVSREVSLASPSRSLHFTGMGSNCIE